MVFRYGYDIFYRRKEMFMARPGRSFVLALAMVLTAFVGFAEEGTTPEFGLDLGLGAATFNDGEEPVTYQSLSLNPDFAIGKFGIGLAVTINYRFNGGDANDEFEVRSADWVPSEAGVSFLELYLPMFRYLRWGFRGDPLYVKLGSIDDATLGNGFIMGNYANTLFLPEQRIFGLSLDIDGKLFNFPFVGFQSFVGNLADFDVIGGRLFARPLLLFEIPILKFLEVGTTLVADIDPYAFIKSTLPDETPPAETVSVWGVDFRLPVISGPIFSMLAFGDFVTQPGTAGGMLGVAGKLFSFLPYGAQLRFLGDDFIPVYFGRPYDLYRADYYAISRNDDATVIEGTAGWFASTGFSIFEDKIALNISIDGPFKDPAPGIDDDEEGAWVKFPHLRGSFVVAEGLLPGFSFDASVDKRNIQKFADLVDFSDAVIGATINYQTGPAVITLAYDVRYNPVTEAWETSAKLQSSLSLF
jgi:hypothetical protein